MRTKTQLSKLLILQKRALRFMHSADRRDHAIPFFLNAKILPLNCLYYKLLAEMMHDVSNYCVPPNLEDSFLCTKKVHSYNTRSDNFYFQRSRLEIKRQSFSRASRCEAVEWVTNKALLRQQRLRQRYFQFLSIKRMDFSLVLHEFFAVPNTFYHNRWLNL